MSKPCDAFKAQFAEKAYPAAFLESYEIIECLSASERGETLLVRNREDSEYCIAKIAQATEFDTERALLSALSHPGLPKLLGQISEGETRILIRSFVEGEPLDEAAARRWISEEEAIHIGAQLCDVLTYLHAQNPPVIHRDIKPQNVILGANGRVALIDLGIARTYKKGAKNDTAYSGTRDFAPPEQYGFSQTDARADIYSLGMLLRYLLTGGDPEAPIGNRRLRRVAARCTAFSPRQRYASAKRVKRALLGHLQKPARRIATAALAICALFVGVLFGRYGVPYIPPSPPEAAAAFSEPIVEQAVRLVLGIPEGGLTASALANASELYIFQDKAVKNKNEFFALLSDWYESGMPPAEDGVHCLDDLARLPNLKTLCVASQPLADISPLAACAALEYLEMRDVTISDIGALSGLSALRHAGLANTVIKDISPLQGLPRLTELDLTGWKCAYSPAPLARMGDFASLSVCGNATAYQYLGSKNIGELRLSNNQMENMEPLSSVTGLWSLDLSDTPIADLTGIEVHEGLTALNLARTNVKDLRPLLALPNLTSLALSKDMNADISVLSGMAGLTVLEQPE